LNNTKKYSRLQLS